MSRIWAIIRREWTENLRQRWLLVTLGGQLGLIAGAALWLLSFLEGFAQLKNGDRKLAYWADVLGLQLADPMHQLVGLVVGAMDYLVLTQLLGMTAVLAGHAALHDRQTGTLPFLLLAPIRRIELLTGKVLGAMSVPLAFYLIIGGGSIFWASTMPVANSQAAYLPPSGGWLVAFFLGAPAWATLVGALCVSISSMARDVRTSQQAAWVLVFFATFVVGPLLVNLMAAGAFTQLIIAAVGALLALLALVFASLLISRDLGR
jgi:ABC-type transport system involved in multi-copper enzyme maturation permease subunit